MSTLSGSAAPFESGEHYRLLRLKLILYFERRNCSCPEDLADDCLNRIFVYSQSNPMPANLNQFAFGFALNVYHEWLRASARFTTSADVPDRPDLTPGREQRRALAKAVIDKLHPEDRELLEQYYLDGRSAESLASEWRLSAEGVRSRVFRRRRGLIQSYLAYQAADQNKSGSSGHK